MTRKDFELIARVVRDRVDMVGAMNATTYQSGMLLAITLLASDFAKALRVTNPNFNAARFVEAALGPPPKGVSSLPTKLADVESPTS